MFLSRRTIRPNVILVTTKRKIINNDGTVPSKRLSTMTTEELDAKLKYLRELKQEMKEIGIYQNECRKAIKASKPVSYVKIPSSFGRAEMEKVQQAKASIKLQKQLEFEQQLNEIDVYHKACLKAIEEGKSVDSIKVPSFFRRIE